ncbi:class I SAM-dependent methyltransferase [Acidiphilium sp.]|uniref:class I SAM-dependent methyltransferase n=1 Tax=Acidiphilium sp. TaxID=527 RepID=UPI003D0805C9
MNTIVIEPGRNDTAYPSWDSLLQICGCPRCGAALEPRAVLWLCADPACHYHVAGFPVTFGQPVLVDFETSIFERAAYVDCSGSVLPRDDSGQGLRTRLRRAVLGHNRVAATMGATLRRLALEMTAKPRILVIGGGAIGSGLDEIYADPKIEIVGTDVYASPNTRLVADGHALPFRPGVFDAVVIQAVLEHVLEPQKVVAEIHRVLRPEGLVYADTPFMQQVHEAAFDFTRFTRSGHRWLFRCFTEIESGTVGGAGTSLLWSMRYYLRAFGVRNQVATLAVVPFVWLRLLERFARPAPNADAASGHYFLGRRADRPILREKDMIAYYRNQALTSSAPT